MGLAAKATLAAVATGLAAMIVVAVASRERAPVAVNESIDGGAEHRAAEPDVAGPVEPRSPVAAHVRDATAPDPATIDDVLPPGSAGVPSPATVTDRRREQTRSTRRSSSQRAPARASENAAPRDLRAELLLIDRAERALRQERFEAVLELTARHREAFPEGELVAERLDLESAAHCALGDLERGRRRLAELRHRWPRSPVSAITTKSCEGQTNRRNAGNEGAR